MTERKVLGRGISSLIPSYRQTLPSLDSSPKASSLPQVEEVLVSSIRANPQQPRHQFSQTSLEELAESIKQVGVLQPLLVRRSTDGYELIAGERRLRASKLAGLKTVPVVVRRGTDREQLEIALIENLQREDLSPIEEASGFERLLKEFSLTQEQIADRVGKKRSTVANLIRLLKLPILVREMVNQGTLSMGHARALLAIEDPRRQEILAKRIEAEELSVRQTEGLVQKLSRSAKTSPQKKTEDFSKAPNLRHVQEELQRSLGTKVELVPRGKGGEFRIHYFTSDDFKRITDRLLK